MDLICNTPFYDRYLVQSLERVGVQLRLAIPTYDREPDYFMRHGLVVSRGLLDRVATMRVTNPTVRRVLKASEWAVNQLIVGCWVVCRRPDVLHVQWLTFVGILPFELWFLRAARRCGVKVVYTVHDVLPHEQSARDFALYREVYQVVDGLICHTDGARRMLVDRFGISRDKIKVIPHGPLFHDSKRKSRDECRDFLGYDRTQVVILAAGMVRPYKGLEFLLASWAEVTKKNRSMLLMIAGRGKDHRYTEHLRQEVLRLGLGESVRLNFNYLPEWELVAHHVAADILVYPYKEITQSGGLLTGMGFGKAIVATDVGAFRETLRDGRNALLVDYGDVHALADRLVYLGEHPEMRLALGQAALAELEGKYLWPDIAECTLEFYDQVLASSPASDLVPVGSG